MMTGTLVSNSRPCRAACGSAVLSILVLLALVVGGPVGAVAGLPYVVYVNKYRTWMADTDSGFRPNNMSAAPLPKYGYAMPPPKLTQFSLVEISKGQLMAFGGEMESAENVNEPLAKGVTNHVLRFDIEKHQWYNETPWTVNPPARIDHAAFALGDTMYIFGGANETVMQDVWSYRNRTWRLLGGFSSPLPQRKGHSANVLDPLFNASEAYFFGGVDQNGTYSSMLWKLNLTSRVWAPVVGAGNAPSRRAYHASAVMQTTYDGTILFIHGGTDGTEVFSDLYAYYTRNNTWRKLSDGTSPQTLAYEQNAVIPTFTTDRAMKHSCAARFPTLFCVGGRASGDPVSMQFDITLGRWFRQYFTNPDRLLPLQGNKVLRYVNALNEEELISIGGVSGRPAAFTHPITMFKTQFAPDACPYEYVDGDFEGRCYLCAPGYGADRVADPHRCFACTAGRYGAYGRCIDCPKSTYNIHNTSANKTACVPCPAGYFTVDTGANRSSLCITCKPSTYAVGGQCVDCPAGTYGFRWGAQYMDEGCLPCRFGTFAIEGQTTCTPCPAGTSSGPFIRNLDPYEFYVRNLIQSPAISGCSATVLNTFSTPLLSDQPFWVTVAVKDWGHDGAGTGAYAPINMNFWSGTTQVFMEFEGAAQKLHINCASTLKEPTDCATFVTLNQTSNWYGRNARGQTGNCDGEHTYTFQMRIADAGVSKIRFMANGIKTSTLTLNVVLSPSAQLQTMPQLLFLANQPYKPFTVYAWADGNLKYWMQNYTGASNVRMVAVCTGQPVTFTVNGAGASSQTPMIPYVNGIYVPNIVFTREGVNCVMQGRNQYNQLVNLGFSTPFQVQIVSYFGLALLTQNVSNHGLVRLKLTTYTAAGAVATADNVTQVKIAMIPAVLARVFPLHKVFIDEYSPINMQVTMGVAYAEFHVHANVRKFNISTWGQLMGNVTAGPLVGGSNLTAPFWLIPANGTRLQLVTYRYKFPTYMSANTTFPMEVELISRAGIQDSTRDFDADVSIVKCSAQLRVVNISRYGPHRVRFKAGRAVMQLFVNGYDASGCVIRVRPINTKPYILEWYSPPFEVISPKRLRHDFVCAPVRAGTVLRVNVTLRSITEKIANLTDLAILMEVNGNKSGAIEVTGRYFKPVVNGGNFFDIQYQPSLVPVEVIFWAGRIVNEAIYNYTYTTVPFFQRTATLVGYQNVFKKVASIELAAMCKLIPVITATRIRVLSRTPVWIESDQRFVVDVDAVNAFGVRDTTYNLAIGLRVKNCNWGIENEIKWSVAFGSSLYTAKAAASVQMTGASYTVSWLRFYNGYARITLVPSFVTDANHTGGVKNCAVVLTSTTLTPGIVENFEVRHTFSSCVLCRPGTFSTGDDGRNAAISTFHPGGCMPCMVGTFSAESGATDESFCEVCLTDYGFNTWWRNDNTPREGVIQCTQQCAWGTAGQVGGGPCQSPTQIAYGGWNEGYWGNYGRIHRRCNAASCNGAPWCAGGTWWLDCTSYGSQPTCEATANLGNCVWNATSGLCQGTTFKCLSCPAGTGRNWGTSTRGIGQCLACHAGGWQTEVGKSNVDHSYYTFQQYYCPSGPNSGSTENDNCQGPDRQECWNGTYSSTKGATSNATCVTCPAGYYCHQMPRYRVANSNGVQSCQVAGCNINGNGANYLCPTTAGCYSCPLNSFVMNGATAPIPCPPGTYNNKTGQHDISACIRCWAGTYCPMGSTFPKLTDTNNTQLDLTGQTMPVAVSYYGSDDRILCGAQWTQDGSGYVQDGHFSNFARYFVVNGGGSYFPTHSYQSYWSGSFTYVAQDHNSDPNSMSIRTNSSRGSATQTMKLSHELPLDMVARVWILYRLDSRNLTNVVPPSQYIKPFVGIEMSLQYVDVPVGLSNETEAFYKEVLVDLNNNSWTLIELNIKPTRAIRFATVSLSTRGFYQGYALFDDVSFRPAHNRICNCSTGFYFNESEPSRKCQRCKPGYACSGGTIIRCVNSWSTSAMAGCQYCRDGWLCDADGRGRHIPCEPYTYKNNNTEECFPCPLGHACKDGVKRECNDGWYGDGGKECIECKPGFYSPATGPQRECLRCPAGHTSEGARPTCFKCPINHYSPNGTDCYAAAVGFFVPAIGAAAPVSCKATVMDNYTVTVPRNRHGYPIRVVPYVCETHYSYLVTRYEHVTNGQLGSVRLSTTAPAVLYDAGPHNFPANTHVFRVFFTSNVNEIEQYATVTVTLTNTAIEGRDDEIWVPHPLERDTTYRITTWPANDRNAEHDWVWVQSVTAPVASTTAVMPVGVPRVAQFDMGATPGALVGVDYINVHPAIYVTLPKGFRGPMHIRPITYDQQCTVLNNDCLETSPHGLIKITARTRPPVAVNDFFRVQVGQVVPLDILKNDYDPEGDLIKIISTTAASRSGYIPPIQNLCPTTGVTGCPTTTACSTTRIYGTFGAGAGQCQCYYDNYQDRCRTTQTSHSLTFVDFTTRTGICGLETFTYTIQSNDGISTGTVTVDNYRCYCDNTYPNNGFNILFVLDGTDSVSSFGFQLAFADGVMKRSQAASRFRYGLVEAGAGTYHYNVSSAYMDVRSMKRDPFGHQYPYTLATTGLARAKTILAQAPVMAGYSNWVVIISSKPSFEDISAIAKTFTNTRFATIAINPKGINYDHFSLQLSNVLYSKVVPDAVTLNTNAVLQEELMDIMCGT